MARSNVDVPVRREEGLFGSKSEFARRRRIGADRDHVRRVVRVVYELPGNGGCRRGEGAAARAAASARARSKLEDAISVSADAVEAGKERDADRSGRGCELDIAARGLPELELLDALAAVVGEE